MEPWKAFACVWVGRSLSFLFMFTLITSRTQRVIFSVAGVLFDLYILSSFLESMKIGLILADWLVPTTFSLASFITVYHLLLTPNPQMTLRRHGQAIPATSLDLFSRSWWSFDLLCAIRGIGWNFQVAHLPPYSGPPSRGGFVVSRVWSIAQCIATLRLLWVFAAHFDVDVMYLGAQTFHLSSLYQRSIVVFFWLTTTYITIHSVYQVATLLAVGSGIFPPESCPDQFGSVTEAYTVRRVWGRTWHQLLRQMVTSYGGFIAHDVLHMAPGTTASYTKLFIAFGLSALIHVPGDYTLTLSLPSGPIFFSWNFFFLQPVVITFEDGVIALGKRLGLQRTLPIWVIRGVGYVWVGAWAVLSVPLVLRGFFYAGMGAKGSR